MSRAPDWSEDEFMILLGNPTQSAEELVEQLPGRSVSAVEIVRQGLHQFHQQGTSSLLSHSMIRNSRPGWICSVCLEQQP